MATNAPNEFDKVDLEPEEDIPQGGDTFDDSYATGNTERLPVVSDDAPVEDPDSKRRNRDSDMALEKDETEAIDKSNVLRGDRLRHAKPRSGGYSEVGDEEGLLGPDEGRSSVRGPGVEGAYDNKLSGE